MIMKVNWGLMMFLVMGGVWSFCSNRKHMLSMLLSLELIVLGVFLSMFILMHVYDYELYFLMVYLAFCVCEGALGLSVLVLLIRTHGNDFFQNFSILQC
nr:NADH dehydrogenase subunit 4L [Phyllozelus siccus siccus]